MIKKKVLIVVLSLLMVLSMAACSKDVDREKLSKDTIDNLSNLSSYSSHIELDLSITSGKSDNIEMSMKADQRAIRNPDELMEVIANIKFKLMGMKKEFDKKLYSEATAGGVNIYSLENGQWSKLNENGLENIQQFDPMDSITEYLKSLDKFKQAGTEKINGVNTVKFEGVMNTDALKNIITEDILEDATGLDLGDLDNVAEALDESEGVPITIWIDTEKALPLQFTVDFSQVLDTVLSQMNNGGEEVKTEKATVKIIMTGYDNVKDIVIPDEAKNA